MQNYQLILHETFEVPADTPILDGEQIEMLQAAGEDLLDELIDTFTTECEPRLGMLDMACQAKDTEEIRSHTHFIAGSAANIGLLRLATLCRNIEEQIKESRYTEYGVTHMAVATEFSHGMADLLEG